MACRQAPPVIKIGLVSPFEGQYRPIGYDAIYSARLAVRQINSTGSIGKYRLALVALDDSGDPSLAAETAAALTVDPAVVAVLGHWLPSSTAAARSIYQKAELPLIPLGEFPFLETSPENFPAEFLASYAAVTPFDEVAGEYSGPTYDAFNLLVLAMEDLLQTDQPINRQTLTVALQDLHYDGLTGEVYRP
jgi:ABC-type branched-subunit amino acid transport system substrate-binding protein